MHHLYVHKVSIYSVKKGLWIEGNIKELHCKNTRKTIRPHGKYYLALAYPSPWQDSHSPYWVVMDQLWLVITVPKDVVTGVMGKFTIYVKSQKLWTHNFAHTAMLAIHYKSLIRRLYSESDDRSISVLEIVCFIVSIVLQKMSLRMYMYIYILLSFFHPLLCPKPYKESTQLMHYLLDTMRTLDYLHYRY